MIYSLPKLKLISNIYIQKHYIRIGNTTLRSRVSNFESLWMLIDFECRIYTLPCSQVYSIPLQQKLGNLLPILFRVKYTQGCWRCRRHRNTIFAFSRKRSFFNSIKYVQDAREMLKRIHIRVYRVFKKVQAKLFYCRILSSASSSKV